MGLEFYAVNAFANSPHSGSQAAVVVVPHDDARWTDETYLQAVAGDFAWPATVFVSPMKNEGESSSGGKPKTPKYAIRWFTKAGELPLCGHGTCAAAHVLLPLHGAERIAFEHAGSGEIVATKEEGGRIGISMPITPATVSPDERQDLRKDLTVATGLEASDVGAHYTVTILTQAVRVKEGMVEIRSRVFIPSMGLDEDTITGSAHAVLTGYYLSANGGGRSTIERLVRDPDDERPASVKPSTVVLDAVQLSARGGSMRCSLVDGRAQLVGRAYLMGKGTLNDDFGC
ncbi:Diaminopimelate epimerase-like protein [Cutaneotrichosporon oleaginosum]|uniref:Diaminopimelate epimerase-like protein n=1 Tax=Cutaneotrichosporon oleaginosum TaxID=879819 RepID=A0A0J0XGG2_9TREE|nr:Diaminopimelate epimerase-like protein [Cutaneotrichosporon oleaginosum]KLT40112.1 Diaminopimelate epimerase-like protein [Cutaneotrichosporon oleaginosum]